ncbi:MAG: DegT/DnrJ/EryC1/StrS family aminotransferase [Humidesulfovibrio sp.]|uniref:DegT/DnrJ/EryC1/StrS family aminotransferase n=1 Tax=Humidesulfovibrio sp. TaxID=2910988 RepID=UPI0027E7509D|nr:DegT/DnrJ/EryC1/StrS family aminotransferase [Humidesulfovibrio sp.]MDQ7834336.1 DegT/DnrJ/EryC1/StrS family aminotransferase [Humidesulfovibrio sp.]
MAESFIPVSTPRLDGNEKRYLAECIDTGWISSEGPFVRRFEEGFARSVDRASGVAVCNGTAALEVAVQALGLGPGDEVILPSFTIISCVGAILRAGATPVAAESDPRTWNMDVTSLEALVTDRTRAIMVVHTYGLPVDMDPVLDLARRRGLFIIEDAAEAHGLTYKGRPCGSFGDMSCFSFYPNKLITTGEGGMVLADDPTLAERARSLRNLCFQPQQRFVHEELGSNFRMTNLQAAVGLAQLERREEFLAQKRAVGARYQELLAGLPGVRLPVAKTDTAENAYWVFGLVLEPEHPLDAPAAMAGLAERGIGTRPFFFPMHEQPVLRRLGLFAGQNLPVAEMLARRGFYIPCSVGLGEAELQRVAEACRAVLGG